MEQLPYEDFFKAVRFCLLSQISSGLIPNIKLHVQTKKNDTDTEKSRYKYSKCRSLEKVGAQGAAEFICKTTD